VLYLSDLDRQGEAMPVSVSRQVEFYRERYAPDADVTVEALVMTEEIEEEFQLPGAPLDDGDHKFGERRGRSTKVELDALEALHPGELRRIVEDRISDYRDGTYEGRLAAAEDLAEAIVSNAREEAAEDSWERLNEANEAINEIYDEIREEHGERLQELQGQLEETIEEINNIELDVDLPDRPDPEVDPPDESNVLFDSSRNFADQLDHYRHHRGQD
jgi:vacuolar-type H+-ATPase subunit H